jgi:hypothetical protein
VTRRQLLAGILAVAALAALGYLAYTFWLAPPSDGPTLLYFRSDL